MEASLIFSGTSTSEVVFLVRCICWPGPGSLKHHEINYGRVPLLGGFADEPFLGNGMTDKAWAIAHTKKIEPFVWGMWCVLFDRFVEFENTIFKTGCPLQSPGCEVSSCTVYNTIASVRMLLDGKVHAIVPV